MIGLVAGILVGYVLVLFFARGAGGNWPWHPSHWFINGLLAALAGWFVAPQFKLGDGTDLGVGLGVGVGLGHEFARNVHHRGWVPAAWVALIVGLVVGLVLARVLARRRR